MAWTTTTWSNADWSAAATLNEFVGAVNERADALNNVNANSLDEVTVGDDVQAATFFTQFQQWVEDTLDSFVVSWAGGEALGAGYYDGRSSIPFYASLAAVFTAAGLDHTDWRRYTTHPDDGGSVAYGQMQAGDIIGPWIFEDIQKCLNVLVWTRLGCSYADGDTVRYYGRGDSLVSLAAAQAAAEAAYAEDPNPTWGATYNCSVSLLNYPGSWGAILNRQEEKFRCSVWNGASRHADWYVAAVKAAYFGGTAAWDNYGDDVIENMWSLFSQEAPAAANVEIFTSTKLGDAATKPNAPWAGAVSQRGWEVTNYLTDVICVLRWDVSGGFTYQ